jgi:hypothetical protein
MRHARRCPCGKFKAAWEDKFYRCWRCRKERRLAWMRRRRYGSRKAGRRR